MEIQLEGAWWRPWCDDVVCSALYTSEKMMRVPKSGKVGKQADATQDVFEFWSSPDFQVTMYVGIELPT